MNLRTWRKLTVLLLIESFEELFDQNFNITNADDFLTTLKETQFLSEHRKIKVGNDKEFKDYKEFEGYVEEVKGKVYQDEEVVKAFEKLEKKLNQTGSSHDIRNIVKKGNEQQIEILSLGRNHLALIMYGQSIGLENIKETLSDLKRINNEAAMILNHAKDQATDFDQALSIYEERFDPPFQIRIVNHIDSFLGMETPEFVFEYKYPKNQDVPQHSEKEIKSMLSSEKERPWIFYVLLLSMKVKKIVNLSSLSMIFSRSLTMPIELVCSFPG